MQTDPYPAARLPFSWCCFQRGKCCSPWGTAQRIHQRPRFRQQWSTQHQHLGARQTALKERWWQPRSPTCSRSRTARSSYSTFCQTVRCHRKHRRISRCMCSLSGSVCRRSCLVFQTKDLGRCCIVLLGGKLHLLHSENLSQSRTCRSGSKLSVHGAHTSCHPCRDNRIRSCYCWQSGSNSWEMLAFAEYRRLQLRISCRWASEYMQSCAGRSFACWLSDGTLASFRGYTRKYT